MRDVQFGNGLETKEIGDFVRIEMNLTTMLPASIVLGRAPVAVIAEVDLPQLRKNGE